MPTNPPRPRVPPGNPRGGQWTAVTARKPGSDVLGAESDSADGLEPDAAVAELDARISDPDPAVQAEALDSPWLSHEQLLTLADPSRPASVRIEVAADARPLSGLLAADDPDPAVRAVVASRSDVPAPLRSELLSDTQVASAVSILDSDLVLSGSLLARRMGTTEAA